MRRFMILAFVFLGLCLGGIVGFFSLDAKYWIYGPLHKSTRYSDFGGAVQGLIEGVFAIVAGSLVFGRLGWLVSGMLSRAFWGKQVPFDRLGWIDALLVPLVLVWAYLIYASW